jgi:hypothetical protein
MQSPRKVAPHRYGIVHMVLCAALAAWTAILISSIPRMTQASAMIEPSPALPGLEFLSRWQNLIAVQTLRLGGHRDRVVMATTYERDWIGRLRAT